MSHLKTSSNTHTQHTRFKPWFYNLKSEPHVKCSKATNGDAWVAK